MRNRNWAEYNKQLVQRGSVTFLIDPKILQTKKSKHRGRPTEFSDALIIMLFMLKIQYHLPYRALEGFAAWIFGYMYPQLVVPSYSLICKRVANLGYSLPQLSHYRAQTVLIDASGVKVMGEGEWKVKIHGKSKRRKWLKIHIAVDADSQQIVAETTTESTVADSLMTQALLDQAGNSVKTVIADGAYDRSNARDVIKKNKARALIPPARNARYKGKNDERDVSILQITGLGADEEARRFWGKLSGYSQRALVETAFSRFKRLFGDRLFSKDPEKQKVEIRTKFLLLNRMNNLAA